MKQIKDIDQISGLKQTIRDLFSAQKLAVLSSYGNGTLCQPDSVYGNR